MPGAMWELQDVKLGAGGEPPDRPIDRVPWPIVPPEQARADVRRRMEAHLDTTSSVEGVVIVNDMGVVQARCTAPELIQERSRGRRGNHA